MRYLAAPFLAAALGLGGCQGRVDPLAARVAALEKQAADLNEQVRVVQGRITAMQVRTAHDEAPSGGATLIVSWPQKGGNDYRHHYPTVAACEEERSRIQQDETARRAESRAAEDRQAAADGFRIIAHGSAAPGKTADCVTD